MMKTKNLTPIGYLIELFDISVKDLAGSIFVDRTTISKWKSGSRPFTVKSEHFEKVVQYFLEFNEKQQQKVLETLFSHLYSEGGENSDRYVDICLQKFLAHRTIPLAAHNIIAQAKGLLYINTSSVYSGVSGRKIAMNQLFNEAKLQETPSEVMFFDQDLFAWITEDEDYFWKWLRKIKDLLEKGFQVSLVTSCIPNSTLARNFLMRIYKLFSYANFQQYDLLVDRNVNFFPSLYILKDKLNIWGVHHGSTVYSSAMRDTFSLEQGQYYFDTLKQECAPVFCPTTNQARIELFENICQYEILSETCYLLSSKLSFASMSEELLKEVLKDNGIIGDMKRATMKLYHTVQKTRLRDAEVANDRHIAFLPILEACLRKDAIYCYELAALVGKPIYINNQQFRTHLESTASLLLAQKNYRMLLASNMDFLPSKEYVMRCKRNLYCLSMTKKISIKSKNAAVNNMFSLLDDIWTQLSHHESAENAQTAKKLLELAKRP